MPLTQISQIAASIKILLGDSTTFTNRRFDQLFDLDQIGESDDTDSFIVEGQVTDQAILFGKIVSPTFIFIKWESRETGGGVSTDGTLSPVTIKVNGSTAQTTNYYLAITLIPATDTLPTTITFSTLVDTNTLVTKFIIGRID